MSSSGCGLRVYNDILEAVEWSPLVRINKIVPEDLGVEIWAKCEFLNPGGSVKDRIGRRMVEEAIKEGRIKPNDILIEPTSGNTGIGMSLAAAVRGYQMVITMPKKMSFEKIAVLQALGAQIVRTRTEAAFDDDDSHLSVAAKMNADLENSHILDQYVNRNNPDAHYYGTGAEIVEQAGGKVDALVVGTGTGGTLTGSARRIKESCPTCRVVGVDPEGSILMPDSKPGVSYHVEGVGYDFIPEVFDRSVVDQWLKSNDRDSFNMARRLIREEGLLCGGSSGGNMHAALEVAKTLPKGSKVVVVLPDSIRNYLTKFVDPRWMVENGIDEPQPLAPLAEGSVATLPLRTPPTLRETAKASEVLPLLQDAEKSCGVVPLLNEDGFFAGVVTDMSLMEAMATANGDLSMEAREIAAADFRDAELDWPLARLYAALQRNPIVLVLDKSDPKGKRFVGIVNRQMMLNQLHAIKK